MSIQEAAKLLKEESSEEDGGVDERRGLSEIAERSFNAAKRNRIASAGES